jgi:hypothetical protein
MTKEEVAQWAVNNRYPKSENNKISDSEMYHTLIKKIEQAINYTHSCTELKDKESIDFEDWKLVEKVKFAYGKYFIGNKEFSYKQLIKEYTSYKRSL